MKLTEKVVTWWKIRQPDWLYNMSPTFQTLLLVLAGVALAALIGVSMASAQTIIYPDGTQRILSGTEKVFISRKPKLYELRGIEQTATGDQAVPAEGVPHPSEQFQIGSQEWCDAQINDPTFDETSFQGFTYRQYCSN